MRAIPSNQRLLPTHQLLNEMETEGMSIRSLLPLIAAQTEILVIRLYIALKHVIKL